MRAEVAASTPVRERAGFCLADLCGLDIERALTKSATIDIPTIQGRWKPLVRLLGASLHPSQITFGVVEHYVISRRQENIRGQTIRRELYALKRGLRLAKRKGWLSQVLEDWPQVASDPRDERQAGKLHPMEILAAWFAQLPIEVADEVSFALLTGLRARELKRVQATWLESSLKSGSIAAVLRIPFWASKTRRERVIGLSEPARTIFERRARTAGPVFSGRDHKRARATAAKKIGYHAVITLRDLRHMFATFAVAGSSPVHEVQRALGHSSIKTTELYLHLEATPANIAPAAVASLVAPLRLGRSPLP